jgi:hypothetical protein
MDEKFKGGKCFATFFLVGVLFVIIIIPLFMSFMGESSSIGIIFSEHGGEIFRMSIGSGFAWGCLFTLLSWLSYRKKKLEQKDDVNDLLRQYLEKQLREDAEKEKSNADEN